MKGILTTGRQRWQVMGCYIASDDASTIEDVIAAISRWPCGAELLLSRKLNAKLADTEGTMRKEEISMALSIDGLEDYPL